MLAEEAAKAPAKRWAIVAPNFKFGQDVALQLADRRAAGAVALKASAGAFISVGCHL
jgi:hypothetical protein